MSNAHSFQSPVTLVLTEGDPAGIGPEIIVRALEKWQRPPDCRIRVLGFERHFTRSPIAGDLKFQKADDASDETASASIAWLMPGCEDLDLPVEPGSPTPASGKAAARCIEAAAEMCLNGQGDAIVTAPINKANLAQAGLHWPGHTEMLASRSGARRFAMMLTGGGLRAVPATIHEALSNVPQLLNRDRLVDLMDLIHQSMPDFGIERPRIGVAGLNPHAGEGGRFGREEIEIIAPAVETARSQEIDASGPFAADTLFHRMIEGEYDVVLAMYHDQALIPVKTLDFHGGVNITLGLPFVRTSPDHGTAYELAGRGLARPDSMIAALDAAYRLAKGRRTRAAAL